MRQVAVIGAGFGDEGKGKVVSHLCSESPNPLVIRFCGGHQAGHRVIFNGIDHIFSNFGSGTLQNIPTYWPKYCTFDPVGFHNEHLILQEKGINPLIYLDGRCPVTTPYDKVVNLSKEYYNSHGTCGVGFGQTLQREQDCYSLTIQDLFYPEIFEIRLDLIQQYYNSIQLDTVVLKDFVENCRLLPKADFAKLVYDLDEVVNKHESIIFEGSQGLMLDQSYGFFPHVTRANTGTKNVVNMGYIPDIYLVTRAYQTRHGNGPMTSDSFTSSVDNPYEHNRDDGHQGIFRTAPLDLSLLKYAINKDDLVRSCGYVLIITCLDVLLEYKLVNDLVMYKYNNEYQFIEAIREYIQPKKLFISRSPGIEMEER